MRPCIPDLATTCDRASVTGLGFFVSEWKAAHRKRVMARHVFEASVELGESAIEGIVGYSEAMSEKPLVRLMHYDPRWRQEFQQTRSSILFSCDGWVTSVEHVGSTAISGLIARPTIDLVAGVDSDAAIESALPRIEGLNYRLVDSPAWATGAQVLVKPRRPTAEQPDPSHLVLLTVTGSRFWNRVVWMRDHLRRDQETAIRFEEAKVAHWRSGEGDLDSYQAAKAIFFAHLEDQIDASRNDET